MLCQCVKSENIIFIAASIRCHDHDVRSSGIAWG